MAVKPVLLNSSNWDIGFKAQFNTGYIDKYLDGFRSHDDYNINDANLTVASPYGVNFTAGIVSNIFGLEKTNVTEGDFSSLSKSISSQLIEPRTNTIAALTAGLGDPQSFTAGVSERPNLGFDDGCCCCCCGGGSNLDAILQYQLVDDRWRASVGSQIGPMDYGDGIKYLINVNAEYRPAPTSNLRLGVNADALWGNFSNRVSREEITSIPTSTWFNTEMNADLYAGYTFCPCVQTLGRVGYFHSNRNIWEDFFMSESGSSTSLTTDNSGYLNLLDADVGLIFRPFAETRYGSGLQIEPQVRFQHADQRVFNSERQYNQASALIDVRYVF
jgi:hypothetical protein